MRPKRALRMEGIRVKSHTNDEAVRRTEALGGFRCMKGS